MSRTDKDAPDWTTAAWYEPYHASGCPNTTYHFAGVAPRACDLPDHPIRRHPDRRYRVCHWEVVHEHRRNCQGSPPSWYINHRWNAPDRRRSRVGCLEAAKEYRASGEVHTVPVVDQHRHGATWDWT